LLLLGPLPPQPLIQSPAPAPTSPNPAFNATPNLLRLRPNSTNPSRELIPIPTPRTADVIVLIVAVELCAPPFSTNVNVAGDTEQLAY